MYMASDGVTIMNEIESAIFNAASDKTNAFIVSKDEKVQVRSKSSLRWIKSFRRYSHLSEASLIKILGGNGQET
jgi:hypothetical protein